MSLAADRTSELWRTFRNRMKDVPDRVGTERYSVQIYGPGYSHAIFDPAASFDRWAAIEVSEVSNVPDGFESMELAGGKYAVFIHRGTPAMAHRTFGFIFETWLPHSGYTLDNRPHFEVLGENYSPFDPEAEEAVLIPIKLR
jgi:AraC family transcriptional regulator